MGFFCAWGAREYETDRYGVVSGGCMLEIHGTRGFLGRILSRCVLISSFTSHLIITPKLFAATRGSAAPVLCARMTRGDKYVILEMTPRAVQIGLVEFCIVATVVLQSGCNIE